MAPHPVPSWGVLEGADVDRSTWPDEGAPLYESLVELLTGRTHQVSCLPSARNRIGDQPVMKFTKESYTCCLPSARDLECEGQPDWTGPGARTEKCAVPSKGLCFLSARRA